MTTVDTIEGRIDGDRITFHYDVFADVLYVRLAADMNTLSVAEVDDADDLDLRAEADGRLVGRTIIGGWRRAGVAGLPDSMAAVGRWAKRVAVGL